MEFENDIKLDRSKCNYKEQFSETKIVRRGFHEEDAKWFSKEAVIRLQKAQEEMKWLLDRGYNIGPTSEFIGNAYQLSLRQRNALQRATSSKYQCEVRKKTLLSNFYVKGKDIYIDGFNLIITLEVALSQGILILCNDGTIRDIAGLRGTYKVIDKTDKALELIGRSAEALGVSNVKFFLDSPVSNSGRLKRRILEHSENWGCAIEVELVNNPDPILSEMERVVTTDSIILDSCKSWFNLGSLIIEEYIKNAKVIDLSG